MIRGILLIVFVTACLLNGRGVWAMSGAELLGTCSVDVGREQCRMYIAGIRDAAQQIDLEGHPSSLFILNKFAWCYPPGAVKSDQEMLTIAKWLKEHTEKLQAPAAALVANALADAFKCGGGGGDEDDDVR